MKDNQNEYRLAPWRKQVKTIFEVMAILIIGFFIIMAYLKISADLTKVKLETQVLHEQRSLLLRQIANSVTQEGRLTAFTDIEKKAEAAGYKPIDMKDEDQYSYVIIDGYTGENYTELANIAQSSNVLSGVIKPEYTESLQDWLTSQYGISIGKQ